MNENWVPLVVTGGFRSLQGMAEAIESYSRALDLEPSSSAATGLYAGISFDSGHFRHASTSGCLTTS